MPKGDRRPRPRLPLSPFRLLFPPLMCGPSSYLAGVPGAHSPARLLRRMSRTTVFTNTLEPLIPLIVERYGVHRTTAYRQATIFEDHVVKSLGGKIARTGKARQLMVDGELWDTFTKAFDAVRSGEEVSLHAALANQFSGHHPGALSLETVHAEVTRTRESLSDLRVFIRETNERHDQQLAEVQQSISDLRTLMQVDLPNLLRAATDLIHEQGRALSDQHARAEQAAETSRLQHSADLQQVVTTHVAALHSALDTQAATISNIETGVRVVAEVVSNIADHFTTEDESGA